MTLTYDQWEAQYPQAAAALQEVFAPDASPVSPGPSEAWAQQQVRMELARQGAMSWRNNVGALPDSRGVPVRFGLANDSEQLNKRIKSSDLILCIPRVVTPGMVGKTIGQFGSVECKAPGWKYTGTERERAQKAWLTLIGGMGGFATFSTGKVNL
jgi:hypothetical protein